MINCVIWIHLFTIVPLVVDAKVYRIEVSAHQNKHFLPQHWQPGITC